MGKKVIWLMDEHDSDLLMETLDMDSESHAFSIDLRQSIGRAINRVRTFSVNEYVKMIIDKYIQSQKEK